LRECLQDEIIHNQGGLKDFNQLSGPWVGLSTQFGHRIPEDIILHISHGRILGTGTDKDGNFDLQGSYDSKTQRVTLTRRYSWTTEPSQDGVGVPYHYDGIWDGELVSGMWHCRPDPQNNGEFEMWPAREEDLRELRIEVQELSLQLP
jgi:hypothetical protein